MYYKAPNNSIHDDMDGTATYLLPAGSMPITDEEAATIRAASAPVLTYAQKRAAEYPPITDYLDGIAKADQAQIDKYIADCQAVKTKYPKP